MARNKGSSRFVIRPVWFPQFLSILASQLAADGRVNVRDACSELGRGKSWLYQEERKNQLLKILRLIASGLDILEVIADIQPENLTRAEHELLQIHSGKEISRSNTSIHMEHLYDLAAGVISLEQYKGFVLEQLPSADKEAA